MLTPLFRTQSVRSSLRRCIRPISTLQSNPHIYIFPSSTPNTHILTLLPTSPPTPRLAIGTTTTLPPTPHSFTSNSIFLSILDSVLAEYAHQDPDLQSQAQVFATSSSTSLFNPKNPNAHSNRRGERAGAKGEGEGGGGGASSQGGAGGAGRGGWVHLSDSRQPPDYGRIAWPEDIFGSVEVDGKGEILKNGEGKGNWQSSGSYRIVTREGILGLSEFLKGKVVERLEREEKEGGGV